MSKELVVSAGRHETRVAILDDDQVVELFHEREKEYSLAGSIHKGRVTRVLPGMQSAFVDIGLERYAFLYVSDFFEDNDEYEAVVSTVEEKVLKMEKGDGADSVRESARKAPEANRAVEIEAAAADDAAAAATGTNGGSNGPEARPEGNREARPEGNRDGRDDRRDRGGRGRRGRRRRGGRGSSLPESKFFSPSAETVAGAEAEGEAEEGETALQIERTSRTFESRDDFMVLPGESLAKYTAG